MTRRELTSLIKKMEKIVKQINEVQEHLEYFYREEEYRIPAGIIHDVMAEMDDAESCVGSAIGYATELEEEI